MKKRFGGFSLTKEEEEKLQEGSSLQDHLSCSQCKLDKSCLSPKMPMTGEGKKGILFIAEAPGETEDRIGKQLVGEAGQLFRRYLNKIGIDLDKDCWKTNAICCRPPLNVTPTDNQIACCRSNVLKVIRETKPLVIGLLGMPAIKSVIGSQWKKDIGSVGTWRGWEIPDRHFQTWIVPTYHPSFILRRENAIIGKQTQDVSSKIFEKDLAKVLLCTKKYPSEEVWDNENHKIVLLIDIEDTLAYLRRVEKNPPEWMSFDYETTGLKPQRKGHDIVCVSMCDGKLSRVFPMYDECRKPFTQFLKNKKIRKIASNLKFEDVWSRVILNSEVESWGWDTMQNAHILDNREDITGLKFQTYVRYGIADYSSSVEKFLKAKNEFGANSFNDIRKVLKEGKWKELLKYCALDSLFEYKLAMDQMKEMGVMI
jgi:DNA polymerase